jgi:hypothetical protein
MYEKQYVDAFFLQIGTMPNKENAEVFCKYHTKDVLNIFMGIWPPPSIWELWNRWNSLPATKQKKYVPPPPPRN